jgi:hypothetical protein
MTFITAPCNGYTRTVFPPLVLSLVRGFSDEKFSARKWRTTEGLRSREGHNKSPLTYQIQ